MADRPLFMEGTRIRIEIPSIKRGGAQRRGVWNGSVDTGDRRRHRSPPVNLFAAFFSFTFAGYFSPRGRGGLSRRKV
jgi:hypothetical protein